MNVITGLRANLVPYSEFALHKWFYSSPLWYYHQPGTTHGIRANPKFYRLVDPDLRELCRILLEAGLHTTPSCQGHFYPRERFERIWDELQREARLITGEGLKVKDSETDRTHLFRDPGYQLPWSGFREFYREASSQQSHGYLGVMVPADSPVLDRLRSEPYSSLRGRILYDDELTALLRMPLFNIYVDPSTPEERSREWMAITRYLKSILSEQACATAR